MKVFQCAVPLLFLHKIKKSFDIKSWLYVKSYPNIFLKIIRFPEHFEFSAALVKTLFHFSFHGDFGSTPHPRQKSGSTKEDVRKGNGYYSNKRKISAKRDKDKKIFSFSKNLLNRNEIKRKNMGIWGYFAAPKAPRKFLRLSTRYFGLFSWKNAVFSKSDTFSESKIEKWHNPESPPPSNRSLIWLKE